MVEGEEGMEVIYSMEGGDPPKEVSQSPTISSLEDVLPLSGGSFSPTE